MQPEISVLMSVYNGEKFVREAIDSILAQTCRDFEFVIINDGSRDATGQILASYNDPRLRVFTTGNSGLPAALNFGLERCRAELVMRMDADDIAYPDRFETLLKDWEQAGQPDVFGSGVDYINEDGKYLWSVEVPLDDASIKAEILNPIGKMAIMHPTVMMRKQSVLSCGGYDPYFRNSQDNDLWLRMTSRYSFGNSPKRLLKYRFQACSHTAKSVKSVDGDIHTGNWMKLISLQKKLMIDAGEEESWRLNMDRIIAELKRRADITRLHSEAMVSRGLTEAKILFYSGKRIEGILALGRLFFRHPLTVLNRFVGGQITDVTWYLLDMKELSRITGSPRGHIQ